MTAMRLAVTAVVVALGIAGAVWWICSTPDPVMGPHFEGDEHLQPVVDEAPEKDVPRKASAEVNERAPAGLDDVSVARNASAPVLTLRGVLAESITKNVGTHDGQHEKLSATNLVGDLQYNPEKKVLSPQQLTELDRLIEEFEPRLTELHRQDGNLTREALLIGLERDQRLSQDLNEGLQSQDQAKINRHRYQLSMTSTKRSLQTLTQHFGEPLRDWAWTQVSTTEPDGVPRVSVVYFLRGDAPGVFAAREQITQTWGERDSRISDFFARQ